MAIFNMIGGGTGGIGGLLDEYELVYEGTATADSSLVENGAIYIYGRDVFDLIKNRKFIVVGERTVQAASSTYNGFVITGSPGGTSVSNTISIMRPTGTARLYAGNSGTIRPDTSMGISGSSYYKVTGTYNYSIYAEKT